LNENEIDEQAGLPTHCGFPIDALKNGKWKERKGMESMVEGLWSHGRANPFWSLSLSFRGIGFVEGGRE
jgi:hypothetical protein